MKLFNQKTKLKILVEKKSLHQNYILVEKIKNELFKSKSRSISRIFKISSNSCIL